MRLTRIGLVASALLIASAIPALANPKVRRGPTAPRLFKDRTAPAPPKPKTVSGIEPERATQIQTALIKAGYLTGAPSGSWDTSTQAAMEKLQADNGWQTRIVPDARAIIHLGLGPHNAPFESTLANAAEETESTAAELEVAPAVLANK